MPSGDGFSVGWSRVMADWDNVLENPGADWLARADAAAERWVSGESGDRAKPGDPILLGTRDSSNPLRLPADERSRHMYVLGASGMGKSYFLQSLIEQDIEAGRGLCVVDPHGELYDNLVAFAAARPELRRRVILFNPSDQGAYVTGFNPLARADHHPDVSVQVDRFIDAVKRVMRQDSETQPQLESTLRNALVPLIRGGHSLLEIERFFDYETAGDVLALAAEAERPGIFSFWRNFVKMPVREKGAVIGSAQRRTERFLHNQAVRLSCGQTARTLDIPDLVESGKILLVNLGRKGNFISGENAHLLGVLLVNEFLTYGRARDINAARARPFHLYLDEFQHFVTSDIEEILTGGRKFGLHLTFANQELSQIEDEKVLGAVLSARTQVVFGGVSPLSARIQEENLGTHYDLMAVKHWDERTFFEPRLEKRRVHGHTHGTQSDETTTSGKSQGIGSRSGMSYAGPLGRNRTRSTQDTRQASESESRSARSGASSTDSVNETWVTDHVERRERAPRFWSLDEQRYLFQQSLRTQPQRVATVQIGRDGQPMRIRTLDVEPPRASEQEIREFKQLVHWTHPCYAPSPVAERRIAQSAMPVLTHEPVKALPKPRGKEGVVKAGTRSPFAVRE